MQTGIQQFWGWGLDFAFLTQGLLILRPGAEQNGSGHVEQHLSKVNWSTESREGQLPPGLIRYLL